MQVFRTFPSIAAAREYRHLNGTGGWIFAESDGWLVILFPPDMSPNDIFNHPFTKGRSGDLLGSA